jgi:hypothetical protein
MLRSRSLLVGSGLLAALSAAACSSDSLTNPGTTTLEITTSTTGTEPDADGYTVQVDGGAAQTIGASASMQRTDLSAGDHTVRLAGIAPNCSLAGDNPRTVTITAGQTATVSFAVTCGVTTGGLQVTSTTTGPSPDADGFTVTVDGAERGTLGASGAVNVDGLTAGNHVVGVSGVAANCQVQGDNPRTVTITPGTPASIAFTVTCTTAPAGVGTLRVKTTTTGADLDPNGYVLSVDAGAAQPIGVNANVTIASVPAGSHTVTLGDLASGCTVQDANPRTVTVAVGAETAVSFTVTCGTSGGIQWTTIPLPPDFSASALWASSPSDIFVVAGKRGAPSTAGSYVLHYNGQGWTEQFHGADWYTSPYALWGSSPTDVFAAGNTNIWHYDGATWVATPRELELYGAIWGSSPRDVFAAGVTDHVPEDPFVLHYDGTQWSSTGVGFYPGTLFDIAGSSATDVWAVGIQDAPPDAPPEFDYQTSEVVRYDGTTWHNSLEIPLKGGPNDIGMNAVWSNAPTDVFAVGSKGRILHYDGTAWSPMTSPTSQDFRDIWGSSSSNVYAVGSGGILHYDGTSWTLIKNTDTWRVWGVGTDVFVISGGQVIRGSP